MALSDLFKVTIIQRQITWKWYNIQLYLQWPTNRESRIWSIKRRHFQWPWTTPTPSFKVTSFFNAEYLMNGTTYRHSFNEILTGTYTRPTQQCHFEWPCMTLSDLEKYSMTRSVARSLCDSWASCSACLAWHWPDRHWQCSWRVVWTSSRMCADEMRTLRATIVTIFSHMTRDISLFVKCDIIFILFILEITTNSNF